MPIDIEARNMAETASLGVIELNRKFDEVRTDITELKQSSKNIPVILSAIVTLATVVIGSITQFQVAHLGAVSARQADVRAESTSSEKAAAIKSELDSKLNELRTEIEKQRRTSVAPIAKGPDLIRP